MRKEETMNSEKKVKFEVPTLCPHGMDVLSGCPDCEPDNGDLDI